MTFLVDKMSPNLFSNKIPNQPAHLKLSVCLHSVETLGMRKVVSSQGDNYTPAPPSKNTPMCIVTPPTTIFVIICFQLCPALSFMARSPLQHVGTETLEMFFRPFCPPRLKPFGKTQNYQTQIGPFLGQSCLFVCPSSSCSHQCWPFIGIPWQAAKNWVSQSRSRSFVSSSFIFCSPNIRSWS